MDERETFWQACRRDWCENEREHLLEISAMLTLWYWFFILL